MSFFIAGAIVLTTAATTIQSKKAQKKAKKDAEKDAIAAEKQARKAEVFAETEGEGIGDLGRVSLEIDDEEDLKATGKIRI